MPGVPTIRIRAANQELLNPKGDYVLYWMIAHRRPQWNFGLDRAVEHSMALRKPLLILEAVRSGYRWASDRLHAFILQGMGANQQAFADQPVTYYPYVEIEEGTGSGLLEHLAEKACVVVTDDFPCYFLPRMVKATAKRLPVLMEEVDSNGLFPLRATDRVFHRAFDFRRFLQQQLLPHLSHAPKAHPFKGVDLPTPPSIPKQTLSRWPKAIPEALRAETSFLGKLPIDHAVGVAPITGGHDAAHRRLIDFMRKRFDDYGDKRNEPEADATSGFSPYLHFGHLSIHEVFHELVRREEWKPEHVTKRGSGQREGWWNMSPTAESFIDEAITWRELGYNMCSKCADYDTYESLPDWAQETLAEHAKDKRDHIYTLDEFEHARTHDPLWNAAQNQIRLEGRMHNYLRMLWGKKILEWSKSPRDALSVMIELNNKYGLDGRNPNSYTGIFWVLGRYDRAWGPERPIFGKIRYMSSDNTARKYDVEGYIEQYASLNPGEPPRSRLF